MCEKCVHSYTPQFWGWGGGLSLCPNLENGKEQFFSLIRNPASIGERKEGGVVGFWADSFLCRYTVYVAPNVPQ
jgi:hypothetical protein